MSDVICYGNNDNSFLLQHKEKSKVKGPLAVVRLQKIYNTYLHTRWLNERHSSHCK